MIRYLDSRHLRLIAEVARAESVTRAADRLNVTQSAVSHQLREIEGQLRTPIFIRSGRRMLPTPAGRLIVDAANDVLASIERLEAQIEQLARHEAGELRVCTHCYTGYAWLPSLVGALHRRYPNFVLQVVPEYTLDPLAALLDAKLDVALMNDESDDRRLRHRELFDDEHVAVVPAGHRWASLPFVAPEDIAREPLYLFSRSIENSFLVRKVLKPAGLAPANATYLQLSEGILEMVKAGMGATVLPKWSITQALDSGDIKAIRITRSGVFRKWYAVTLADAAPTPVMDEFIRLLIRQTLGPRRHTRRTPRLAS
jgi:LysR family transcriptional regulator, regulator for metE and metH